MFPLTFHLPLRAPAAQCRLRVNISGVLPTIHPGVIPVGGEAQITVIFTPVQYETSQITIQVVILQFNTKSYLCTITGSSAPHLSLRYSHQRTLFPGLADPLRQDLWRQHHNHNLICD